MAPDVARALARLGERERYTGDDDFVFAGEAGLRLDGDALSSRYRDALGKGWATAAPVPRICRRCRYADPGENVLARLADCRLDVGITKVPSDRIDDRVFGFHLTLRGRQCAG
jgi:hypothetical protein